MSYFAHHYDLSYVSGNTARGIKPQIVFTISEVHFEQCMERMRVLAQKIDPTGYLSECADRHFYEPNPNIFGDTEFGYGKGILLVRHAEEVEFRIDLRQLPNLYYTTLNLHCLTWVLGSLVEYTHVRPNRVQQVSLRTRCEHTYTGWGHMVNGYVSPDVRSWLRRQAVKVDRYGYALMPQEVIAAMQEAWCAITDKGSAQWAKECNGAITEDGRFIFVCPGNACDIAIYPDQARDYDGDYPTDFSCHNLDHAKQQITLVVGLAKLCELARAE